MLRSLFLLTLLLTCCLYGCNPNDPPQTPPPPPPVIVGTFLALGDSYTIGESVAPENRWPVQLADSLRLRNINLGDPRIIARTGWTTDDLDKAIEEAALPDTYDLVSLLIGVNNQYRGYEFTQYTSEFPDLLRQAIALAGGRNERVIVVSIPDYGVTPFGQSGNPEIIAEELDAYNDFARQVSDSLGVLYFNITPISREAAQESALIADDNLHPSGVMYQRWVSLMLVDVEDLLND